MRVNYYTGTTDNTGTAYDLTWSQLIEALSKHDCREGKEGPLFNCVVLDGLRRKPNVREVHALVLDIEHVDAARADQIHAMLAPFDFILYSSHRSRHLETGPVSKLDKEPVPGEIRLRGVIPYSRPVTPELHDRIWQIFAASIPEMDAKCREPAHFSICPQPPQTTRPSF